MDETSESPAEYPARDSSGMSMYDHEYVDDGAGGCGKVIRNPARFQAYKCGGLKSLHPFPPGWLAPEVVRLQFEAVLPSLRDLIAHDQRMARLGEYTIQAFHALAHVDTTDPRPAVWPRAEHYMEWKTCDAWICRAWWAAVRGEAIPVE